MDNLKGLLKDLLNNTISVTTTEFVNIPQNEDSLSACTIFGDIESILMWTRVVTDFINKPDTEVSYTAIPKDQFTLINSVDDNKIIITVIPEGLKDSNYCAYKILFDPGNDDLTEFILYGSKTLQEVRNLVTVADIKAFCNRKGE